MTIDHAGKEPVTHQRSAQARLGIEPPPVFLSIPRRPRPWLFASMCCLATFLAACGQNINSDQIAASIKLDITSQGAPTLKEVLCPKGVPQETGKTFKCVGELESGTRFAIAVTQQDNKGTVQWEVPNAKGLLNLITLQGVMQQAVSSQFKAPPTIDCGGKKYRSVKPGETFECKIILSDADKLAKTASNQKPASPTPTAKPGAKPAATTVNAKPVLSDRIVVTIDPDRNVTWQQVLPDDVKIAETKPGIAPSNPASQSGTAANPNGGGAPTSEGSIKPTPLPPPTAEEIEELGLDRLD